MRPPPSCQKKLEEFLGRFDRYVQKLDVAGEEMNKLDTRIEKLDKDMENTFDVITAYVDSKFD